MKKWQQNLIALLAGLGFSEKVKAGSLTADEQKILGAKYEETYGVSLDDDKKLNEDVVVEQTLLSAEQITELATLMNVTETEVPKTQVEAVKVLATAVKTQKMQIKTLSDAPEVEAVAHVQVSSAAGTAKVLAYVLGKTPHTKDYLFGIEAPTFARGKWYNEMFVTRKSQGDNISESDKESFIADFQAFSKGVKNRITSLIASNSIGALDYKQMIAGESLLDYSSLEANTPEYSVRRTDLILAFFRSLPSVSAIFPVVSGIQNKEIAPNANFGELSQGYRSGRVFKGNVNFAAEIYSVTDLMFKFKFTDMIKMEKLYIGYLNREGSDPMKWAFMEWLMIYFGQILINEQNRRRVCGTRVPQQNVAANPANLAGDGALRAIERVEEELKILPFEELGIYDKTSMLDVVEAIWDETSEIVPVMDGYQIYANARHKQWYKRLYRAKYALNEDFTGATGNGMADLDPNSIIWVPNMPLNCYKIWITIPLNIENYEDKPMEMLAFYFQQDMDEMMTRSRWKEGSGVLRAGVQYATKADMIAANREFQWIFTNFPCSDLPLTATISLKDNTVYEITGETGVVTVNNFKHDFVYKFIADETFATTKLVKSGAFAKITADFVPGAEGDYIKVYAELADESDVIDGETVLITKPTGLFLELERKVTV